MTKSGITIFESLIVLVIIALIMIMTQSPNVKVIHMELVGRQAFEQLINHINIAKDISMTRQVPVQVIFDRSQQSITIESEILDEQYAYIQVPTDWQLQSDFDFKYLPNGRINHFQSIRFLHRDTEQVLYIVFQLGSGKFDVNLS